MDTIAELPFLKLNFDEKGALEDPQQLTLLLNHLDHVRPRRLSVVSHGWRNDADYATSLYRELFTNVSTRLKGRGVSGSGLPTVVGVYWPSLALPEEFGRPAAPQARGSDGAAAATRGPSVDPDRIKDQLDALIEGTFGGREELEQAKNLLDDLEDRPGDQIKFVELLRSVAPPTSDATEDNSERFLKGDPRLLFDRLARPIADMEQVGDGRAASFSGELSRGAGAVLNTAQGALGSAFRLVNYLTFYVMKERAEGIGRGLNRALAQVRTKNESLPIHLVGHSFGARVVTAAAARGARLDPCSLSLLQGAYSHNGLAAASQWEGAKDGYFRAIFAEKRVNGPIIATHTVNDQAVGVAYPIASRLAGQNADALGDAADPYGGVGRNGILHVLAGERGADGRMLAADGDYEFAAGKTNNLLADKYIMAHGDVRNPEVANAVAQVILSL
jgi:hypothetical protein